MSGEAQLLLVIAGMHLFGLVCAAVLLLPALRNEQRPPRWDSGSDGGPGKRRPPAPPPPGKPGGGLPLPDAAPAAVRLRGHERLPDRLPRRQRRPAREPARDPVRNRR